MAEFLVHCLISCSILFSVLLEHYTHYITSYIAGWQSKRFFNLEKLTDCERYAMSDITVSAKGFLQHCGLFVVLAASILK